MYTMLDVVQARANVLPCHKTLAPLGRRQVKNLRAKAEKGLYQKGCTGLRRKNGCHKYKGGHMK
jgi:hypothetical protein